MSDEREVVEIRFLAPTEDVAVLDALCIVNETNRAEFMRDLVHNLARKEIHRAQTVMRVVGKTPERSGKGDGK